MNGNKIIISKTVDQRQNNNKNNLKKNDFKKYLKNSRNKHRVQNMTMSLTDDSDFKINKTVKDSKIYKDNKGTS